MPRPASRRPRAPARGVSLDRKQRGELAELAFWQKAAGLGFIVSKPYTAWARYDLIVDAKGNLWRVQVKSTSDRGGGKYCVSLGEGGYSPAEIDLLAILIVPRKKWYLVPIEEVSGKAHLRLMGQRTRGRGGLERYFERWSVLETGNVPRKGVARLLARLRDCLDCV